MLIVQKYGGTSVGSPERMRAVAARVAGVRARGDDVVVVVSAMGHTTDELVGLAEKVVGDSNLSERHPREVDMLLSAGERIAMALLAMAIREAGVEAMSLTGSQAAIITDDAHTAARIREVRADRVRETVTAGKVPIVAGFQGVSSRREVTTLGRGGSDTTAVALAVALDADRCEIYTDVKGIFTADPRRVSDARIIPEISFDEMLELASGGAQVMHPRAIEIASKYGMDVWVGSSFEEGTETLGTRITRAPQRMEELALTGITANRGQAKLVLRGLPGGLHSTTTVVVALADAGVSVDMISEAERDGRTDLQVTVSEAQVEPALKVCEGVVQQLGGAGIDAQRGLTRVAMVGSGMHQRPGVYARAFRALLEANVEIFAVSTSGISITVWVQGEKEDSALRALHSAFSLELEAKRA